MPGNTSGRRRRGLKALFVGRVKGTLRSRLFENTGQELAENVAAL